MSACHLDMLRRALEENHWVFFGDEPGNDYDISGIWNIARPNGDSRLQLAFSGLDDLDTLPLERSYGCHVVGEENVGLYFGRIGRSIPGELARFMEALSRLDA